LSTKKTALKAVLFDLDNTLYAYDPCNEAALRHVCAMLNNASPITWEKFRTLHDEVRSELAIRLKHQAASHNRVIFFKEICERLAGRPQPKLAVELYQAYWQEFYRHMQVEPDALQVLEALRSNFRLGIVSNHTTEIQLEKIDRLGLADCFDTIVTSEEAGAEKPAPAIFDFALARLDVRPAETAMVGDHPSGDIQGAQKAGILAIHTRQYMGAEQVDVHADHTIERLRDVLSIVQV
jgi:HAD superfamily hydrolase (TIGR02253 family)